MAEVDEGPSHVQERILALRQVPALRAVPPRVLGELAGSVELESHPAGVTLLREAAPVGSVAWILEGRARWERAGRGLGAADLGASIGVLEATAQVSATARARAETPVVLARVSAERWIELLEDSCDLALAVLSSLASELATLGRRRFGDAAAGPFVAPLRDGIPTAANGGRPTVTPLRSSSSRVEGRAPRALDFTERLVRLRLCRPFARAPIRAIAVLAERSSMRVLGRGAVLWPRGREAREIALVVDGVITEGQERFGPSDTLGVIEALAARSRDAAAVASSAVTAITFDVEALIDVLEDDEELTLELLREHAGELLASGIARGLPPDVLGGAPDRSLPRPPRRSPLDTVG